MWVCLKIKYPKLHDKNKNNNKTTTKNNKNNKNNNGNNDNTNDNNNDNNDNNNHYLYFWFESPYFFVRSTPFSLVKSLPGRCNWDRSQQHQKSGWRRGSNQTQGRPNHVQPGLKMALFHGIFMNPNIL